MPETDDAEHEGRVDAGDEGEQAGVAAQIVAELMEGAQSFLGLGHEVAIGFEDAETERVVDMLNGYLMLAEGFAEEHVLVAVMAETLVEGVLEHDVATHEEVGGVDVLIGLQLALFGGVAVGLGTFVEVAQVAVEPCLLGHDGNAAVDHAVAVGIEVIGEELRVDDGHVAVDEEDIGIECLLDEVVADGGSTNVLLTAEIEAVGHRGNHLIGLDGILGGGAVVAHDDLVPDGSGLCLVTEGLDEGDAGVIVGRDEYGKCPDCHIFMLFQGAKVILSYGKTKKNGNYLPICLVSCIFISTFAPAFTR